MRGGWELFKHPLEQGEPGQAGTCSSHLPVSGVLDDLWDSRLQALGHWKLNTSFASSTWLLLMHGWFQPALL